MRISLVIPAYNEAKIIAGTVRAAEEYLSGAFSEHELIIVDDGSTDGTAEVAAAAAGLPTTRLLGYGKNRGKGCAVRTGMLAASGELVFFTDADMAYGLEPIGRAAELFARTGADAVVGSRELERGSYGAYPPLRLMASRCFSAVTRAAAGLGYDTQCGFKGFTREAAQRIFRRCETDGFAFDFEVMLLLDGMGLRAEQLPVRIINHRASTVHVFSDSFRMLADIIRIRRSVRGRRTL